MLGEFWIFGVHRRAAVSWNEVAALIHPQLGLDHRRSDAGHKHAPFPAANFELQNDAENAASGAGNQSDSGTLQEVQTERPEKTENEQGSDGNLQPRGD